MTTRSLIAFGAALAMLNTAGAFSASALTTKECSAKYNAAKAAGTLAGQSWNAFRKAQCGADAAPAPAASTASQPGTAAAAAPAAKSAPAATAPATKSAAAPAAKAAPAAATPAPAAAGKPSFPSAVSAQYSKETPSKARMHTCLDQYRANKANGGNAGLKWIQKGGGYFSQCNKALKG